jgi:para-nitrobenzyl esterase
VGRRSLVSASVAGLVLLLASASAASASPLVVRTQSGWVRGAATGFARQFLGIPYAAPPTGARRLAPPRPPRTWSGVRNAVHEPANCPQPAGFDPGLTTTQLDEDCLLLDVITPMPAGRRLRPVYVFIHGGAFLVGHLGFENMRQFVEDTGVVAVTINYRVGALGFLDLPGMRRRGAGNFGILDQQGALRWVKRNIRAFGGDPGNVTVGGQSAGGGSVCAQLASPRAHGLFSRAILESGWDCNDTRSHADARAASVALAHKVGCTDDARVLTCMRAKPVAAILDAEVTFPLDVVGPTATWAPEIRRPLLPRSPAKAFQAGAYNRVPVLLGSNSSDITALGCQTQSQARSLSRWAPTYRYEFADETAPPLPGRPPDQAGHGAQHSAELEYLYLFNGLPAALDRGQQLLADQMIRYWSRFTQRGTPNVSWLPRWPRFTPSAPNVFVLKPGGLTVTTDFDERNHC